MDLKQVAREQLGGGRVLYGAALTQIELQVDDEAIISMGAGRQGFRTALVAVTPSRLLVADDKSADAIPLAEVSAVEVKSAGTGTKVTIRWAGGERKLIAFGPSLRATEIRDLVAKGPTATGAKSSALDLSSLPAPVAAPVPAATIEDPLAPTEQ